MLILANVNFGQLKINTNHSFKNIPHKYYSPLHTSSHKAAAMCTHAVINSWNLSFLPFGRLFCTTRHGAQLKAVRNKNIYTAGAQQQGGVRMTWRGGGGGCLHAHADGPDLPAGAAGLFGWQWVLRGCWRCQVLIKVINLLLIHLHHHWPLQLHSGACGTSKRIHAVKLLLFLKRTLSSTPLGGTAA